MLMHIPNSGTWKFDLAYYQSSRFHDPKVLRIPLPSLESVDIRLPIQDLRIEVPQQVLRRARIDFEALPRRR